MYTGLFERGAGARALARQSQGRRGPLAQGRARGVAGRGQTVLLRRRRSSGMLI